MAKTNPFQYIQQVRSEVSKVVWPTRREVLLTTAMVLLATAQGMTDWSMARLCTMPTASRIPASVPMTNPASVAESVTQAW